MLNSHKGHESRQHKSFAQKLQGAWYNNTKWVWLLAPLTLVFWFLSCVRRSLYQLNILKPVKANIPVIVVGNIGVGGNGKTPLTLSLIEYFIEQGFTPAVLSRGYGGKQTQFPHLVTPGCAAELVGDEPALIAKRLGCIVVIDPQRVRGCQYIEQHTAANVIICDDGLQHYAMARDIELCVLDKRGVGNGFLLPMGPLREGQWRLNTVDAVIVNQGTEQASQHISLQSNTLLNSTASTYAMHLHTSAWVNILTHEKVAVSDSQFLKQDMPQTPLKNITAIAGIGDPQRFFDSVKGLNITTTENIGFDDHHAFSAQDIPQDSIVLMTEKDAVKCAGIAHKDCWYLQIDARLHENFYANIMQHPIIQKQVAALHHGADFMPAQTTQTY